MFVFLSTVVANAPGDTPQADALPVDAQDAADRARQEWFGSPERRRAFAKYLRWVIAGYALAAAAVLAYTQEELFSGSARVLIVLGAATGAMLSIVQGIATTTSARAEFEAKRQEASRSGVEEAIEQLRTELTLPNLIDLNRIQMDNYHAITRDQATDSYRKSQIAMGAGMAILVAGAATAVAVVDTAKTITVGTLTGVGTLLSGYVSQTYLRAYETALDQLNYYFEQPLVTSYLLTAERLVEKMGTKDRNAAYDRIISRILEATITRSPDPVKIPRRSRREKSEAKANGARPGSAADDA